MKSGESRLKQFRLRHRGLLVFLGSLCLLGALVVAQQPDNSQAKAIAAAAQGASSQGASSQGALSVLGDRQPAAEELIVQEPRTEELAVDDAVAENVGLVLGPIPGLVPSVSIPAVGNHNRLVATAKISAGQVAVWAEPDSSLAPMWELAVPTEFDGLRHFLVLDDVVLADGSQWLKVQVPVRPNGTEGWLPATAVTVGEVSTRLLIDISDRSVIVWDAEQVVLDTTGAVGAPATPTPSGSFYIRDMFPWDAESVYGPWVFALSAYSEVIDQINGGDAVVAIHGTHDPSALGKAISLGCIRLDNETVTALAALVQPGTPVEVVP